MDHQDLNQQIEQSRQLLDRISEQLNSSDPQERQVIAYLIEASWKLRAAQKELDK